MNCEWCEKLGRNFSRYTLPCAIVITSYNLYASWCDKCHVSFGKIERWFLGLQDFEPKWLYSHKLDGFRLIY